MKKLPGSLEIKLHEKLSKNDILNILAEQMTMLEETFGIQEFKIYSYLECYRENKKQALYHQDHNIVVGAFNLRSQENLENTAKLISKEGNNRIISFDKKLDTDKMLTTVENIQTNNPYRYWSNDIQIIPASKVSNIIQNEQNRQQAEKDRFYLIEQQRKKEELVRKAREKEEYERPLKYFINTKIKKADYRKGTSKNIFVQAITIY